VRAVVALVAARDEGDRIEATVGALRSIELVTSVVVVDDGSRDDTAARALAAGATVLRHERPRGKGGALEGALGRLPTAQVWLLADGDLAESAAGLGPLLAPVVAGDADLVIGIVPPAGGGGFGFVKRAAGWAIRRLGGIEVGEPLSGQRALTDRAMQAVRPLAPGFALETAMTIDAARAGLRILELPVAVSHRPTGRTIRGFAHRARQGLEIAAAVGKRSQRRP
jgi:hypothetical protein